MLEDDSDDDHSSEEQESSSNQDSEVDDDDEQEEENCRFEEEEAEEEEAEEDSYEEEEENEDDVCPVNVTDYMDDISDGEDDDDESMANTQVEFLIQKKAAKRSHSPIVTHSRQVRVRLESHMVGEKHQ
jgi:hypothetical protein